MSVPYVQPASTTALPGGLTLNQFLQTVFVGLSGVPGPLVRPKWQVSPPKQPDITTDWMALGVDVASPDTYGYLATADGSSTMSNSQRHETLEIGIAIYGPNAIETYGLIRDGFQIPQNLEQLRAANMGYIEIAPARHIPDLINERFVNRVQTSVFLRREIIRTYPVPTLISASGIIYAPLTGNHDYLLDWETQT